MSGKRTATKKKPIKDRAEIKHILENTDFSSQREKWHKRGVPTELVWDDFYTAMLDGTAWNPEPNPLDYVNFQLAFGQWCSHHLKKYGPQPHRQGKPEESDYPSVDKVKQYAERAAEEEEARIQELEHRLVDIEEDIMSWSDDHQQVFIEMLEEYTQAYCPQMLKGTMHEPHWKRWNALIPVYNSFLEQIRRAT